MAGLSERKTAILQTLVEASPDRVVGALQSALADTGGDVGLSEVRRLVEAEAQDRRLRNGVLQPVAGLFAGDGRLAERMTFPARALALIWRGLKSDAPAEVAEAAALLADFRPGETPPDVLDALVGRAAESLRSRAQRDFANAAELCDDARPDGAELLSACLDLGPICRSATLKLGEWISRTSDANSAAARLTYKDAVAIADDAGARLFEMLATQLAQPWMVLRIISAVMDRPSEKYLAESELASFALRLMDAVDRGLDGVAKLDVEAGPRAGSAAAKTLEVITQQIGELEASIESTRDGPWGSRIAKQKHTLAAAVEDRLRAAEKAVAVALPTQPTKIFKMVKNLPRLTAELDERAVVRARTLLTFAQECRSSASHGGFASVRAKVLEKLGESLDQYVEEVLDQIRGGELEDLGVAMQHLAAAADFNVLIRDDKAGELVRRRAAAAAASVEQPSPAA
ncbi:hypothetical protein [Phenylobacterium sp.]|jgi:hypothetical protein|uniref:hypothetical protein n=1 Tax=Phenylobacterium sp. TaxID=1871053 RepID=UPI002F413F5C